MDVSAPKSQVRTSMAWTEQVPMLGEFDTLPMGKMNAQKIEGCAVYEWQVESADFWNPLQRHDS